MKKLILVTALIMNTLTLANVECTKEGRYFVPKNEIAKDIAKALKVKTCNGKRFSETVKKLGMTSNVVLDSSFNETALLKKYKK